MRAPPSNQPFKSGESRRTSAPPNVSGQSPSSPSSSSSSSSRGGKYGNIVNQFEVNAPGPLAHFELNYGKNDSSENAVDGVNQQKSIGVSGPFAMTNEKRLLVDGLSKGRRQERQEEETRETRRG